MRDHLPCSECDCENYAVRECGKCGAPLCFRHIVLGCWSCEAIREAEAEWEAMTEEQKSAWWCELEEEARAEDEQMDLFGLRF